MEFWLGAAFVDTREYLGLARAADRLGFHALAISDHIFHADYQSSYPYSDTGEPPYTPETHWPDPWVTIGAMAAVTERLRFATNVYIAPARDLFTVAKAVSTAAVLSGDRAILGLGVGWCKDEFVQTGQDFHTRGKRLDEMIPTLRKLWQGGPVEHQGDHYAFPALTITPTPDEPVPIYIGGDSDAALRRTARVADGWIGNRIYSEDDLETLLTRLDGFLAKEGRTRADLRIVAPIGAMPNPDLYKKWQDKGVTGTMAAPWWLSPGEDKITTMERFAHEIIARTPEIA
ncbi:TIGR03619 family F420-dependent LLM class oxidoreductase [Spirillospora sp. CA-294931]|uniref:TIGR03619 family F420-dependent LLM class oxidoreductase n=1 Tax=Spirillospora sp. CA-294931 TaxID=3240042 RepID=UPI003D90D407